MKHEYLDLNYAVVYDAHGVVAYVIYMSNLNCVPVCGSQPRTAVGAQDGGQSAAGKANVQAHADRVDARSAMTI